MSKLHVLGVRIRSAVDNSPQNCSSPDLYRPTLRVALIILQYFCDFLHTATPITNANFLQDNS